MTKPPRDTGFDGKAFARALTAAPGVYRMYGADESVLYVGKAASLNKRVASYFTATPRSLRLTTMISQIARMEVTVTRTEAEALLLENQLIKSLKPRYNVLLRDDKSYPYIYLATEDRTPRIAFYRGARSMPGRFFGPYPSAASVREALDTIHKLFRLRSCEDSVFRNRSRPCLQFQIQRCSAPCVNLIDETAYRDSVRRTELFLDGRADALAEELGSSMERASAALEFEEAARLRDLIAGLRKLQARQYVDGDRADLDVLACVMEQGAACVMLLSFRNGMNHGTRGFFPRTAGAEDPAEVLSAFVTQYYLEQRPPREIVLSHEIPDHGLIEDVLSLQAGVKVQVKSSVRGERARYLELAHKNAALALSSELASNATQRARVESLQELLGLAGPPRRIECFDISHTQGEATVASCVVFDAEGAVRSQYRRYNIAGVTAGDDFAAMRQVLERRFRRAQEERARVAEEGAAEGEGAARLGVLPDLLLIDGGKGQLAQALQVMQEAGITGIEVVGVAKGAERRAGHETLVRPDGSELRPGPSSPALQLIQQVRDEAHRFAITGHRGRRAKTRERSRLEDIPGIGARRRAMLLRHFGGLAALKRAGVEEIARVEGINAALAQRIYHALHGLEQEGS
jgi:excinuclease ABC subunit C